MPGGVWLAELAPVARRRPRCRRPLLTALGLRETRAAGQQRRAGAAAPPTRSSRLVDALAGERLLIVLDNCEHLIDAVRPARRPSCWPTARGVRILATSREPLGITGETLWPGAAAGLPPAGTRRRPRPLGYPAVRLFADRAAAVRPGFTVDADTVAPVLADLPAARRHAAGDRAGRRPAAHDDGRRRSPAGSTTGSGCSPAAAGRRCPATRRCARSSTGAGTCWTRPRRAAAPAVGLPGGATLEQRRGGLRRRRPAVTATCSTCCLAGRQVPGQQRRRATEPRYRMLETIRAYGAERLAEAGEAAAVRRAHAALLPGAGRGGRAAAARRATSCDWLGRLARRARQPASPRCAGPSTPATPHRGPLRRRPGWYWFLRGRTPRASSSPARRSRVPGDGARRRRGRSRTCTGCSAPSATATTGPRGQGRLRAGPTALDRAGPSTRPLWTCSPRRWGCASSTGERGGARRAGADCAARDPWLRAAALVIRGHAARSTWATSRASRRSSSDALAAFRDARRALGAVADADRAGRDRALAGRRRRRGKCARGGARLPRARQPRRLQLPADPARPRLHRAAATATGAGRAGRGHGRGAERRGVRRTSPASPLHRLGELARRDGDLAGARRQLDRRRSPMSPDDGPPQFGAMINSQLGLLHALEGDLARRATGTPRRSRLACSRTTPRSSAALVGFADSPLRSGEPDGRRRCSARPSPYAASRTVAGRPAAHRARRARRWATSGSRRVRARPRDERRELGPRDAHSRLTGAGRAPPAAAKVTGPQAPAAG